MPARLAGDCAAATIRGVEANTSITDRPLGPRSHLFSVRGAVETDTARELELQLRDVMLGGKTTVVVELTEITELSAGLIGALIRAQRSLNWRNGRLLLACESEAIRHQLADLDNIFELVDTRPQRR